MLTDSALFSVIQRYSVLFSVIQHYSALFSLIQGYSALLSVVQRVMKLLPKYLPEYVNTLCDTRIYSLKAYFSQQRVHGIMEGCMRPFANTKKVKKGGVDNHRGLFANTNKGRKKGREKS